MSLIFSDNFSAYTVGISPFDGWRNANGGGGVIVDFSTHAGGNFHGQTGKGCNVFGGEIIYGGLGTTSQIPAATVVWVGMGDEGSPPSQTIAITTDTTNGFNIASLVVEPDYTVSLYVDSQPFVNVSAAFANTPTQLYNPNVWQLWQVSWSLSSVPFVTGTGTSTHVTNFIGVTASVWLEGTLVINGAFGVSGVSIGTGSDVGAPLINEYAFSCPPGDGYLAEIWATDSFLGTTTFPFIGSPPGGAARMTQGVFEYAATKPSRNVRMTQGVVEIPMRPTHRNMRMTQGVVEIIKKGGAAGGWVVQEV